MSERNKKTPWDEELQAQVLADEQSKRDKARTDQLDKFDALSAAHQSKPATPTTTDSIADDPKLAELLALADKHTPEPEPEKPSLGIDVDSHTFSNEDAAVKHFERAFAPDGAPENLWTRLESHFGARELRIYVGAALLILVALLFSLWFKTSASGIKAAQKGLEKHNSTVEQGADMATELETAQ